jgi:hypothetical protein
MFRKYSDEIRSLNPLTLGCVYEARRWMSEFDNPYLLKCVNNYNNVLVNRQLVIDAFEEFYIDKKCTIIKPFLLTMIWGFERPGYGPFRTNSYLYSEINLSLIEDAFYCVKENEIELAYKKLMKIKGLGISYGSKLLYFAARGNNVQDYPLIFDIRVANALVKIGSAGLLSGMLKIHPLQIFTAYDKYNKFIHESAKKIDATAEQIEYFLFRQEF